MDKQGNMEWIDECFLTTKRGEVYTKVVAEIEKRLIEKALEQSFGNQVIASKILGINRNTLRTKVKKLNIDVSKFKI